MKGKNQKCKQRPETGLIVPQQLRLHYLLDQLISIYPFAQPVIIKYQGLSGLNKKNTFSQFYMVELQNKDDIRAILVKFIVFSLLVYAEK